MFRYVLVAAATLVLSVPVTGQTRWQPPQTSDGQPDMQGFWRNGTAFRAAAAFRRSISSRSSSR